MSPLRPSFRSDSSTLSMSTDQVIEGRVFGPAWPEVHLIGDHDCSLLKVRPKVSPREVGEYQVVKNANLKVANTGYTVHFGIRPIDILCDDVLSYIFHICAATYGNNYHAFYEDEMESLGHPWSMRNNIASRPLITLPSGNPFLTPSHGKVPFIFLAVNQRWRRVALDTCTLWNRVSVMPNPSGQGRPNARFIQHWLGLSGNTTPLFLHIAPSDISCLQSNRVNLFDLCKEEKEERATLGLFFNSKYAERCKVLSIQFNKALLQKLDELLNPDSLQETPKKILFARVEALELRTELVDRQYSLPGWLGTFPSLRRFYLVEGPLGKIDVNELPIASLKTVHITKDFPFHNLVNFIRKCTGATDISLVGINSTMALPQLGVLSEPQTNLPKLTKLSLRECPRPGPYAVLSCFTMSNLRELEISPPIMGPVYPFRSERDSVLLIEFLSRSGCHLDRLTIIDMFLDNKDMTDILSNPIVLAIPEVDIVYASETLAHSPKGKRMFCRHSKSSDILRYGGENRAFFLSHRITLLFWTTQEIVYPRQFQPYELWEHVGWNKNYKGKIESMVWKDRAQGKSYPIQFKLG
ncbi:hypothetical protein GALMADRAFT_1342862 [Galerina marginata CBS 339.88]|uniref:F-box domain-containing protein n=1 Tax=Galerina marginata (strain CBS 339.88) TaxID=685588 RepID=A0A067SSQ8_GALM3|nr:hypothetical protein GALMADRAFT_1342862 [Galerina marginata CBS 339.88]